MERRALNQRVEFRAADDGAGQKAVGYAAIFNTETPIGSWFREKIAPGAFANAIKSDDVRALFNHDSNLVLGRNKAGTLRLEEDDKGLRYEIDLPDTQVGRDVAVSLDRGDVDGSSFAFRATREEWDETGEIPLRTVLEAELYDVGPVTYPAYEDSEASVRDALTARDQAKRESEARHNSSHAVSRIAARRARAEQKFRGIKPLDNSAAE
jgi:HK97 family phage prohead protease